LTKGKKAFTYPLRRTTKLYQGIFMQHRHPFTTLFAVTTLGVLLTGIGTYALAGEAHGGKSLALLAIRAFASLSRSIFMNHTETINGKTMITKPIAPDKSSFNLEVGPYNYLSIYCKAN